MNAFPICETFKISCLMGRPYERRFGEPFIKPIISFGVSGRQSSRVTKVPLAELHRVLRIMESLEFAMKRKRRKVK